ncbi:MAG: polysaccharide deacetylase family protein [Pirellulales bacterium]|nr:polysaccharide deacetylase family protein [Pirellulales bacterium]
MRLVRMAHLFVLAFASAAAADSGGNRLTYLDEFADPYYAGLDTAKLITPQWIGEEGVEAVVVLSIDDMRDPAPYEEFLRPILNRLKKIDGRAPVSIMTPQVDPNHAQLAKWFAEGVSVEAHTFDHPCPCLQKSDFGKAKATYDRCIDLLATIPNYRPLAFRMPCCDSMNSMSPRFYAEVFNKTTPAGNFLRMNSSVFLLFTPKDPELPLETVIDEEGRQRFGKYAPLDRNFVNYVEDYPYPYVVARLCWEMPSAAPDDWLGFNRFGAHSPTTVRDMKAAIDATVAKKGVFTLTFHPGRWIRNDQVIELIDHAVARYGSKVKFLNLREVHQRLTENLLAGHPLRADNGQDNGVRIADLNGDGYMDVAIGNEKLRQTRIWSPDSGKWVTAELPVPLVTVDSQGNRRDAGVRFGVLQANGMASILVRNETDAGLWHFDGGKWTADPQGLAGLEDGGAIMTSQGGRDRGVRLRDLDGNGICELLVGNGGQQGVFSWAADRRAWRRLPFTLPPDTAVVDAQGRDAGLRFADIDGDCRDDVVFSNAARFALYLYASLETGWSRRYLSGERTQQGPIPMIVRADGTNNGVWLKYGHIYVQNEDTGAALPNHIDARSYTAILAAPPAR